MNNNIGNPIAYLFEGVYVYCLACRLPTKDELKSKYPPCKLWMEYILPKSQYCHQCNKILVPGSEGELFPREGNPWAKVIYDVVKKELDKNAIY